jgi:hypothetical protein
MEVIIIELFPKVIVVKDHSHFAPGNSNDANKKQFSYGVNATN